MKYDRQYAELYAALWAYGFETVHVGGAEGLYRAVAQMAVAVCGSTSPVILDYGCGVGRTVRDCAMHIPLAHVFGCDLSAAMIDVAKRVVTSSGPPLAIDLSARGFDEVRLPTASLKNVTLWTLDGVGDPTLRELAGKCTLVLSVNTLERVDDPVQHLESIGRLMAPGGSVILATCRNWLRATDWDSLNRVHDLLRAVESNCAVTVREYFTQLPYKEIADANGACEMFDVIVLRAARGPS